MFVLSKLKTFKLRFWKYYMPYAFAHLATNRISTFIALKFHNYTKQQQLQQQLHHKQHLLKSYNVMKPMQNVTQWQMYKMGLAHRCSCSLGGFLHRWQLRSYWHHIEQLAVCTMPTHFDLVATQVILQDCFWFQMSMLHSNFNEKRCKDFH